MIRHLLLLIGILLGPVTFAADSVKVDVRRENGHFLLRASFSVAVSRETVWSVMTDFEHMAEFMPQMKSSKIVSQDGNHLRVMQQGVIPVAFFDFSYESTRDIDLTPMSAIQAHSVGGNTGTLQSSAQISAQGSQSSVTYSADWVPASTMLANFGVDIMREQVSQQFTVMQQEMLKRQKRKSTANSTATNP